VATIGVFDGVHCGHHFIFREVIKEAKDKGVKSLAITFFPHPKQVLKKEFSGHVNSLEQKKSLIAAAGLDYLFILESNFDLFKLSGFEFFEKVADKFNIVETIVGDDFNFGRGGNCGIKELKDLARVFNFKVKVLRKQKAFGEIISSSLIRDKIKQGNFNHVAELLGRPYQLQAKIVSGRGIGTKLGFPTANLDNKHQFITPKTGVYAAYVKVDSKVYAGAVNIGYRPTFSGEQEQLLEVHIIDFKRNIVGKQITLIFLEKLRDEQKFPSTAKLKQQIAIDIKKISAKYSTFPKDITQLIV
jgi:riboflavin kinase/FMN adenylyltransferase